jgi:hypothetical protein
VEHTSSPWSRLLRNVLVRSRDAPLNLLLPRRSPPSTACSPKSGETFTLLGLKTFAASLRSSLQIPHSLAHVVHSWRSRVFILPFFLFFFLS